MMNDDASRSRGDPVLVLAVLACAAVILARIAGAVAGLALSPAVDEWAQAFESGERGAGAVLVDGRGADLSPFLERNIFHAARDRGSTPEPQPARALDCVAPSADVRLVGTWIARDRTEAIAVIDDRARGETIVRRLGEPVFGNAKVRVIEPGRVLLEHDGRCEVLAYDPPVAGAAPAVEPSAVARDGIRKLSADEYEITRDKVIPVLSDMRHLAGEGRIVPAFEGGRPVGFKVLAIRPGGLYAAIGLENGDIVQRIDGVDLVEPKMMISLYSQLLQAERTTVDLVRRGKPRSISYHLR